MRKSIKMRVMCLAIAGIMLTGSLVIAAVNGSPYENLKNAVFNAMTYENVTVESRMQVTFDGVTQEFDFNRMIFDRGRRLEHDINEYGETVRLTYNTQAMRLNTIHMQRGDTVQWYSVTADNPSWSSPDTTITGLTQEDRGTARVRFVELLVDFFVGDLKHNLYNTSYAGNRRISGSITHNQLPELVRVGMELLIEESRRWYNGDYGNAADYADRPMDAPLQSVILNRASMNADIDSNGNLIYLNLSGTAIITNVFGQSMVAEITAQAHFTDIGTSVVQIPILGAAELFTPEFMQENFGRRYNQTVYFTLNPDGTINFDSITTRWPDAQMRGRTDGRVW